MSPLYHFWSFNLKANQQVSPRRSTTQFNCGERNDDNETHTSLSAKVKVSCTLWLITEFKTDHSKRKVTQNSKWPSYSLRYSPGKEKGFHTFRDLSLRIRQDRHHHPPRGHKATTNVHTMRVTAILLCLSSYALAFHTPATRRPFMAAPLRMSSTTDVPIILNGQNIELTPAIEEYVKKRIGGALSKLSSNGAIKECDVVLSVSKNPKVGSHGGDTRVLVEVSPRSVVPVLD